MSTQARAREATGRPTLLSHPVHVVSLSGGRDSAAVGVWAARQWTAGRIAGELRFVHAAVGPRMEPDTPAWIAQYEAFVLRPVGLRVEVVTATREGTDSGWDAVFDRPGRPPILPGPLNRACTVKLKILPMHRWRRRELAGRRMTWIVGFRADEGNRRRVESGEWDIDRVTDDPIWRPFVGLRYGLEAVRALLADAGVPEPSFYEWTTRSGCVFCFFKPRRELARAAGRYPTEFQHLAAHEARVIAKSGRPGASPYVITKGATLPELVAAERAQLPLFDLDAWDERSCGDPLRTCEL
jgi:3'-phosphoadenosine 5'-phosphosulfate sulfotransferase (PAPS reductase)/FAD synthetase